jgi:hypothetical protein
VLDSALDITCDQTLFTNGFTACSCRSAVNTSQSRRRQLQDGDVEDSFLLVTKPLIVVEAFVATTAIIVYTPEKATSVASLSFILAFFIICAFFLALSIRTDRKQVLHAIEEKKAHMTLSDEKKVENTLMTKLQTPTKASLRLSAKKAVYEYLTSIIPVMFRTRTPIVKRLYVEFYRNHRYLTPKAIHEKHKFSRESDDMCHVVWVGQLLVVQAVVFFCFVLLHLKQVMESCRPRIWCAQGSSC